MVTVPRFYRSQILADRTTQGIHEPVRTKVNLPPPFLLYVRLTPRRFKPQPHFNGWTIASAGRLGMTLAAFGGVAGFAALCFAEGMRRVRRDILQKIPGFGSYWIREIPP